ncbi:unnamed protein product [Timema podura]|uniref:TLC domain-containing protein n=1 Tax=Timema podura TaxID=61482 RepID=A0ABN7NWY8_TIMPD|nr:unnamed protein product [Timema podura]
MDMMINHRKRSSYELMIHHVVVIICFGLSVMTRYYLGYGLMALLVEVNSIFLHIRQLMLIQSLRKSHILYRLNSLLTIGTFIVFRITTLGWMTRWLVLHRDELSVTAFTIGSASNLLLSNFIHMASTSLVSLTSNVHVSAANVTMGTKYTILAYTLRALLFTKAELF